MTDEEDDLSTAAVYGIAFAVFAFFGVLMVHLMRDEPTRERIAPVAATAVATAELQTAPVTRKTTDSEDADSENAREARRVRPGATEAVVADGPFAPVVPAMPTAGVAMPTAAEAMPKAAVPLTTGARMIETPEPVPESAPETMPEPLPEPAPAPAPAPEPVPEAVAVAADAAPAVRSSESINPESVAEPPKFAESIYFTHASSELSDQAKAKLDRALRAVLNTRAGTLVISGHTDALGNADNNAELSLERARACQDYLVSQGLDSARVGYAGMGEAQPVASNASAAGRAQNRRVDLRVLGKL